MLRLVQNRFKAGPSGFVLNWENRTGYFMGKFSLNIFKKIIPTHGFRNMENSFFFAQKIGFKKKRKPDLKYLLNP